MKKNLLKALSLLLSINTAMATEGIILVLEAPLLKEPSMSSTVLQVLRKGSRVYIPNEIARGESFPEFIPTFDRTGTRSYVPSKYVKLITGLPNESKQPITYEGHDPTDYRLEEPIPKTYPFPNRQYVRASLSFQHGSNAGAAYAYNTSFNEQDYGNELGARITVMRKISYDKFNRFYFGLIGGGGSATNEISFLNTANAKETRNIFRVGPWFTYDAFKGEKYQMNIGSGFTFNYHSNTISISAGELSDERSFSGFSLSPMLSTGFQISDIIPYTDFITGADVSLYLPHTLKANNEGQYENLWNENQIKSSLKTQLSLYVGIQVKY